MLNKDYFSIGSYSNITDKMSLIGQYTIPRGRVFQFSKEKKMRLYVPIKESIDVAVDGGGTRDSYTVNASLPMADSPGRDVNIEIIATWKGAEAVVSNVSYVNGTFDVAIDATAGTLVVYYLPKVGSLQILAEAPDGFRQQEEFYNDQLSILHETNQISGTNIKPAKNFALPERFKLAIYAKINGTIDLSQRNGIIDIPFTSVSLEEWLYNFRTSPQLTPAERSAAANMSAKDIILRSWTEV